MDLGMLSLIVSCLAFFLAIPLSILGNILTPQVRDWWAANTGRQRLEKRICRLQEKLRNAEESWCFTEAEWEMYDDSYWNKSIFFYGGMLLALLILVMLFFQLSSLGFSGTQLLLMSRIAKQEPSSAQAELMARSTQITSETLKKAQKTVPWITVLNLILSALIIWRQIVHVRNRADHSEVGRREIRKQIDKLSQKLPASPGRGASVQV